MLEMLTVPLNVPKNMPRVRIHFNIFLISNFLTITAPLNYSGPDRSVRLVCPETVFQSPQCRIIRHETRSSDLFQRQTGRWTGLSDLGSDHPTLYSIIFKNVLFPMFCLGKSYDMIFISCISKTDSLLERH